MRRFAIVCCAVMLVGCAKQENTPASDTTTMTPPPAMMSAADVAGKWSVRVMPEMADTTLLTYELDATADPASWTITFPGRAPMPVRVSMSGDSLVMEVGPYESVLRKGVQVSTHAVARLEGGRLTGTAVAHYVAGGADSVVMLRTEGTRAQ